MRALLRFALATLMVLTVGEALGEVTFYEHDDFRGRSFTADRPVDDFMRYGFNDRASSVRVRSGTWQLCTDADFRGRCVNAPPGDYRSLEAMGLNDRVSSVRPVSAAAAARPRGRIALYEWQGFDGRAVTLDNDVFDFAQIGFNDRATSAVVEEGSWQLCEHERFQGSCMTLNPGRYPNLGALSERISSARLVGAGPGPRPEPRPLEPDRGAAGRAVLYAQGNFQGRSLVVDGPVLRDLATSNFNDRARSLRVESGYWMFCSDANFEGECRTFGPGDYATLPPELRNSISSARRISDRYPYRDAPNWRGN